MSSDFGGLGDYEDPEQASDDNDRRRRTDRLIERMRKAEQEELSAMPEAEYICPLCHGSGCVRTADTEPVTCALCLTPYKRGPDGMYVSQCQCRLETKAAIPHRGANP